MSRMTGCICELLELKRHLAKLSPIVQAIPDLRMESPQSHGQIGCPFFLVQAGVISEFERARTNVFEVNSPLLRGSEVPPPAKAMPARPSIIFSRNE